MGDERTPAVTAAETFVDVWAGAVRRLAPEVRRLRDHYESMDRTYAGGDPRVSEDDLYEVWQQLWAAQHHLVWAAYQLERWLARLARESGQQPPAPDPVLRDLRHALEHLDEAEFDEEGAATPGPRSHSLRDLPQGRLQIGPGATRRLFDLLDDSDLERRALDITTTSDQLMAEAEAFVDWLRGNGEWPPAEDAEEL